MLWLLHSKLHTIVGVIQETHPSSYQQSYLYSEGPVWCLPALLVFWKAYLSSQNARFLFDVVAPSPFYALPVFWKACFLPPTPTPSVFWSAICWSFPLALSSEGTVCCPLYPCPTCVLNNLFDIPFFTLPVFCRACLSSRVVNHAWLISDFCVMLLLDFWGLIVPLAADVVTCLMNTCVLNSKQSL